MNITPIQQDELDELLGEIEFEITPVIDYTVKGSVRDDGVPVVTVTGRVLGIGASSLVDTVARRYINVKADLILDLTKCTFMASVALGFIATLAEQLIDNKQKLFVKNPNDQAQKIISMLGFSDELVIFTENDSQ